MGRVVALGLVLALAFTGYAQARGGIGTNYGRRGGYRGVSDGSTTYFLKKENQPGYWKCSGGGFFGHCARR